MVLATYKKELIVCRRMSDGETEIDRKISINSKKILAISYSRNAICYATEHAYFVHNLTHSNAPIHLFDFDSGLLPPLISNVGTVSFAFFHEIRFSILGGLCTIRHARISDLREWGRNLVSTSHLVGL